VRFLTAVREEEFAHVIGREIGFRRQVEVKDRYRCLADVGVEVNVFGLEVQGNGQAQPLRIVLDVNRTSILAKFRGYVALPIVAEEILAIDVLVSIEGDAPESIDRYCFSMGFQMPSGLAVELEFISVGFMDEWFCQAWDCK
jgi:hypothetical protein